MSWHFLPLDLGHRCPGIWHLEFKNQIDQIEREIDQMVYDLYGLTPEEVEIVENQ